MTLNSTIKSLETKLPILVTAMAKEPATQKSHFTHAERYEPDLNPEVWLSLNQAMLHNLPPAKQDPKYVHIQGVYDPECFPRLDTDAKEVAEGILNVSFPRSKGPNPRHIGDIPAGISWYGEYQGQGFDPMPNKEESKVL